MCVALVETLVKQWALSMQVVYSSCVLPPCVSVCLPLSWWQDEDKDKKNEDALGMLARLWTGVHFEMRLAGLVLNIIHSTPDGPSELAAFSVDGVEVGKSSGSPRVAISVWHFQVSGRGGRGTGFVCGTPLLISIFRDKLTHLPLQQRKVSTNVYIYYKKR